MNIAEILKDCPKGIKLYCPIYGTVILIEVDETRVHPIITRIPNEELNISFTKDGRLNDHYEDAECVLFPSKDNHNWNILKKYNFVPFQRVLVRDADDQAWFAALYSHQNTDSKDCEIYPYITLCGTLWKQCVPYEGNEKLIGTTKNPVIK